MSRYFLLTALLALVVGSLLGLHMALGMAGLVPLDGWPRLLHSHAVLQVHGFMVMLVLGVALLVLPRFLDVPLAVPKVALLSWGLLSTSVLLSLGGWNPLIPRLLEVASIIAFLVVLRRTRASAPYHESDPHERRLNRMHAGFMASGALWLLLSVAASSGRQGHELVLWGFASMYVAGIGLRVHPQMLGFRIGSVGPLVWSLFLWNVGLGLELAGWSGGRIISCAGAGLYLLGLNPFRPASFTPEGSLWLRSYLRTAYAWLAGTLTATVLVPLTGQASLGAAALHLLTSGFLLTMIVGMAFELISTHGGRPLLWPQSVWPILLLLTSGGVLRFVGHVASRWPVFGLGVTCQLAASLLFCLVLGVMLLKPPAESQEPPAEKERG